MGDSLGLLRLNKGKIRGNHVEKGKTQKFCFAKSLK